MLHRQVVYQWHCDKCDKIAKFKYSCSPGDEFPIMADPPRYWMKIGTSLFPEHLCPDCVKSLGLNFNSDGVVDWAKFAREMGKGKGDIIRISRVNK